MKILQITPRYYPSLGGVEETVRQYSEKLVHHFGHEVTVFTSHVDSDNSKLVNDVLVERLWTLPGIHTSAFLPILPSLGFKLLNSNFDLWHLHANKRFTTDTAALIETIKKTPYVFSPYAGMFGSTWLGRLHNRTVGKLAFNAALTIVISNFEKSLIEKENMPVKRFETLPIGIDVTEFSRADKSFKSKHKLENNLIVLFVGRLTKHKGLDTLFRAAPSIFNKFPEARLVVVGPDFGEKTSFLKLAQELHITAKVIFTGSISRAELLSAYKSANVFCLPSRSEAFGIVSIEAFAAGVPVVAANSTAIPEIVRDGETGLLFETESPTDLADKLSIILTDKKSAQKLINNASLDVAEKYNWDKIVTRLNSLYTEVIGK